MNYSLFISCPHNLEYLLEEELTSLGLEVTRVSPQGVYGQADLSLVYKICLWTRIANRVQLILFSDSVSDATSISDRCAQHPWQEVFSADKSLAIEFHGQSSEIKNTMYGAQLIKDGVVDYFKRDGARPNIDKRNPDILLHAHLKNNILTVSLDLVGYSLHQRGYRRTQGAAPLKENIAAAILLRCRWPELAEQGYSLVDPFCGSGTFLIEAAMIAAHMAPGLIRSDQAIGHWEEHDDSLWQSVIDQAKRQRKPIENTLIGFDHDPNAIRAAEDNIQTMDLTASITVKQQAIKDFQSQPGPGLLVCNPPYGERIKDPMTLLPIYQAIGQALFTHAQGWHAGIFTSEPMLAQAIGLRIDKHYHLYNGALPTTLYYLSMDDGNQLRSAHNRQRNPKTEALYNRLTKNKKHLAKWLKRTQHSCYRLYDADLPEYAFAIDVYADWAHVQEYAPPKEIPEAKAKKRCIELLQCLPEVLDIPANHIVLKQRKPQKGSAQYQPLEKQNKTLTITEGAARFKINLHDYLDTGLFLDHRPLRLQFSHLIKPQHFLNCFCYTGTFSVHAALNGATTCNVDLSRTYLNWAKDNFALNRIDHTQHQFIQANCIEWLQHCTQRFDVILLDPPSFSNSKRMAETFDVLRDHATLIDTSMKLLTESGTLYFSNNLRKFQLSEQILTQYQVTDITTKTIDEDFRKAKHCHRSYSIKKIKT